MLKSRWIIAATLGLAVVFSGFWYSWGLFSAYQENHSDERASAAQYYSDATQHGPDACRTVMDEEGLIDWLTCLADNIGADGGVKQSEYDLKAQQDMAAWAFGMLIVTVWLALITLFGVFFVWRTLKVTRDMARDTREIGQKQARAYLFVQLGQVEVSVVANKDGSNLVVNIATVIANSGNSPAYSPIVYYDIQEAIPNQITPISSPETMQKSPEGNSFIPPKGEANTRLSRVFAVDDPIAFQRFEKRLIRFTYCVNFLDEFNEDRWTPIVSGTFHHWPKGEVSFLPDKLHEIRSD
ncbi:MAG: hypothetical protein WA782_01895 [Sulfitobacter sp.]